MKNRRPCLVLALLAVCPMLHAQERTFGTPTLADATKQKVELGDVAEAPADADADADDEPDEANADVNVAAPVPEEEDDSLRIVIELVEDDRELNGVLLDTQNMVVDTAFGPASIPLLEILGIRLSRSATETTTVVLHNGDMITGQVNIKTLMIQTNWGKSEVNGSNLASIFFRKGLAWKSLDLLAGPRWTLVEVETGDSAQKKPKPQTLAAQ